MLALAEFIMRSRRNAFLVITIGMVLPIGAWLSSSAAALVLLRYGVKESLSVSTAGLLAGLWWFTYDSSNIIWILIGTCFLATILRICVTWQIVVLASMLVGVISAILIYFTQTKMLDDVVSMMINTCLIIQLR